MRKILSLILLSALLLSATACGNGNRSNDNEKNELDFFDSLTVTTLDDKTDSTNEIFSESSTTKKSTTTALSPSSSKTKKTTRTTQSSKVNKPSSPTKTTTVSAKDKALREAKAKADKQLYLEAMNILKKFLSTSKNAEVENQLSTYQEKYVDQQIQRAKSVFSTPSTDYKNALNIINAALQNVPDSTALKDEKIYYQGFAPVFLSNVTPYQKTVWFKTYDTINDVFGNAHNNCIRIEKNFTSADGTYDLGRKYNTLSMNIFGLGDGNYGSVKVYADDVCIYSNTAIDVNTRPFNVTLDVTGVLDLKIEMYQSYNSYLGECFGLSEVKVQKTVK